MLEASKAHAPCVESVSICDIVIDAIAVDEDE